MMRQQSIAAWWWLLPPVVALFVALCGWQFGPPVRLDVGAPTDVGFVAGLFAAEQSHVGSYRWTGKQARVQLPTVRGPVVLDLSLGARPGGSQLTIGGDGTPASFRVEEGPMRRYLVLWHDQSASGETTIHFGGDAQPIGDDPRQIVALVNTITLRSTARTSLPPIGALALLVGCTVLVTWLLRVLGISTIAAGMGALIVGVALAAGWGWARLWVAPHLGQLMLWLLAITATLALLRVVTRKHARLKAPEIIAILATVSAFIPLYLFLDYGLSSWLHWHNLPVLLLPLGLLLPLANGKWRRALLLGILLASAGYGLSMYAQTLVGDYAADFFVIFRGARGAVHGTGAMYLLDEIRANPLDATYKYPPMAALVIAPLTGLTFTPAFLVWRIINLVLLMITFVMLLRIYQVPIRSWTGMGCLLVVLTLRPLSDTIGYGQFDILLLVLLVLRAVLGERYTATGVFIGIGAALKIYPIVMLGWALAQRRWQPFVGAAGALVVLAAVSTLLFGWPVHEQFLREVMPATGQGTAWVENQTFNGFLSRLLSPEAVRLRPEPGELVRIATYGFALALLLLTSFLTRRDGGMPQDLGFGLWIVAMLLVLPAAWMHYEALLLIPFCQLFVLARSERGVRWQVVALYALAWMLLAHGNLWSFFNKSLYGPFWQLILSYKFYGQLLLYAAIVASGALVAVPVRAAQPQVARTALH